MRRILLFSHLLILMLAFSISASGQYSGTNPNVAAFKAVVANDSVAGFEPAKAVDTLLTTYAKFPGAAPDWVQVDLGGYFNIDGYAIILPNAGELPTDYTFQVSEDGTDWTDLDVQNITVPGTYSFDVVAPDPIMFVRIYMTTRDDTVSFTEIRVFGEEFLPPERPLAKEATNVGTTGFQARWFASERAEGYKIDVGYTPSFTQYVSGYINKWVGDFLEYDVIGLDPGETYYYRVRAYNIAGTSDTWNVITVTTNKLTQSITFSNLPSTTYGIGEFNLTATASSGLVVSYSSSDESVAIINGNTVTVVGTGSTNITASQEGNSAYNPATPVVRELVVNVKELTVAGAMAEDKIYDGNTDASVTGASLSGVVAGDDVILDGATTGVFAQADAGTGIAVSVSMSLSGEDAGNYSLTPPAFLSADITSKELTVSGAAAEDKVYDGTVNASITGGSLEGIIGGDAVTLSGAGAGTFAQAGVGTGIAVTTSMSLAGADAANYTLVQPSLSASITAKDVSVSGAVADNKVYDGTTDAAISGASLDGIVSGDDVTLSGGTSGTFAQAGVGTGIAVGVTMSLEGDDAGNYNLLPPAALSADITPRDLTVTAEDKSREACAENPEFTISYSGFAPSEDEGVLDAIPETSCTADASSAPGDYDITVSGGSAANYTLIYENGILTITPDVTKPELSVENVTVQLDELDHASITPADVVTAASDNCAVADTTLSQSEFTAADIGDVTIDVTVADEAGNTTTMQAVVTVLGASGIGGPEEAGIIFYPNPVKDILTIEAGGYRQLLVKVTSLNGEVLATRVLYDEDAGQLDLSKLQKGVYFVTFSSGDFMTIRKIIKL